MRRADILSKGGYGMAAPSDLGPVGLPQGTPVQVRNRFEFKFHSGFEVSQVTPAGYRLRRRSDGVELPVEFAPSEIRPEASSTDWL